MRSWLQTKRSDNDCGCNRFRSWAMTRAVYSCAVCWILLGGSRVFAGTLHESFDGADIGGWIQQGSWQVLDGVAVTQAAGGEAEDISFLLVGDAAWKNYTVEASILAEFFMGTGNGGPAMGVFVRCDPSAPRIIGDAYGMRLDNGLGGERSYPQGPSGNNLLVIAPPSTNFNQWYRFKVEVVGQMFSFYIDGVFMGSIENPDALEGGAAGVLLANMRGKVDNIVITGVEVSCGWLGVTDIDHDGLFDACDNCAA